MEQFIEKGINSFFQVLFQIPNLSLIIKLFSMIRLIDDFSYYVYHKPRYDFSTEQFAKLAWNMTNSKWSLPILDPLYNKFNVSYKEDLPSVSVLNTPFPYLVVIENVMFLAQT